MKIKNLQFFKDKFNSNEKDIYFKSCKIRILLQIIKMDSNENNI